MGEQWSCPRDWIANQWAHIIGEDEVDDYRLAVKDFLWCKHNWLGIETDTRENIINCSHTLSQAIDAIFPDL